MGQMTLLPDRSVLAVSGAASRDFLQGLVTNDMQNLAVGGAIYAGLLTPQGKIIHDFLIVQIAPDRFLIDCAKDRAPDLLKRLKLYRLRAKLDIEPTPLAVIAAWDCDEAPPASSGAVQFRDPRLGDLGYRMFVEPNALPSSNAGPEDYHSHCIRLGVPVSADLPPDQVFALDVGFEELHGVSFRKGCYVGQEVTSRMKHRSTARRRIMIAEISPPLPPPGTPITADGRELGIFATGVGSTALAHVRLDRLEAAEAHGGKIVADDRSVRLAKPGWLHV